MRNLFNEHVECNLPAEHQIKGPRSGGLLVVQKKNKIGYLN